MTGTIQKYGRPVGGPEVDRGTIGYGDQRACVYDATGVNDLIVYRLGGWIGKAAGSPLSRFAIGYVAGTGAGYPGARIAYTSEFAVTHVYTDVTGGTSYFGDITPFHLPASSKFALVVTAKGGTISHSMRQASGIVATNENFYYKDLGTSSSIPTDPIEGSASTEGHMSLWFESEANVAPNTPSNIYLNSSSSLAPIFYSTYTDPNQTLNNGQAYDKLTQYQMRVWRGGSLLWDTGIVNASGAEQANAQTARQYAGSSLLYDTAYYFEVRHRDILGAWSGYNGTSFTVQPVNTAPYNPTGLLPVGQQTSTDLAPTLISNFDDANEVLSTGQAWDYLNRYQNKVTRVSDGAVMLAATTYTATPTERANDQAVQEYAGSALSYNTNYLFETRHEDRTGAWSGWSSVTFSITSAATVETPLTPAGFIANTTDPGSITAVYRHSAGLAATGMMARILASNGAVIFTSAVKSVSVAANGTLSMTWAESGFAAYTTLGGAYRIEVLARDTNGIWSTTWSPYQTITFNAAPLTPAGMVPIDGKPGASRPLVTVEISDPNAETPAQGFLEITSSGGTTLVRTMTRVGATNTYQFQMTAAEMPAHGTFELAAYSYDGYLYSGGSTTAAGATRSAVHEYIYAAVPAVTLTGPSSPVSTTLPTFTWTTVGQVQYRLRAYHPVTNALVYDTGNIASSSGSAAVAPGYWLGRERWNTGEIFNWVVGVQDGSTLWGESAALPVQLVYTPPDPIAVTVSPEIIGLGVQPTAQKLTLAMSTVSTDSFDAYEIWRTELLADNVTPRAGSSILLAEVTDITATVLLDAEITSKQPYRWDVLQRVTVGADTLRSATTSVTASLQWDGVMLHCPADPTQLAIHLLYGADESGSTSTQLSQPMKLITPYGGGTRLAFFGPGESDDPSGEFALLPGTTSSADEQLEEFLKLYRAQSGGWDGSPKIICWRDGTGGSLGRVYGVLDEPTVKNAGARGYTLDLDFAMATFKLGVQS